MMETQRSLAKGEAMNVWVGGKYRMIKKIGAGAFGEIFLGDNPVTGKKVAIKLVTPSLLTLDRRATNRDTTYCLSRPRSTGIYQAAVLISLDHLPRIVGIPTALYFGVEGEFNVLITELLGPSLEELLNFCSGRFTLPTTLVLADQMVFSACYRI